MLDRDEPYWPSESKAELEGTTLVLKVLISEKGRVVRVVVEEGVSDREVETAATDAVLHWTYAPAMHDGRPLRSWTTGRFTL